MAQQSLTLGQRRVLKFVLARERFGKKRTRPKQIHPTNRSLAGHTVNERTSLAIDRPPARSLANSRLPCPQLAVSLFRGEPAKRSLEEDYRVT
jgi:hypothetical protein